MRPKIVDRTSIERALTRIDVVAAMADGFVAYSDGRAVVAPVSSLMFDSPRGDIHIKAGYLVGGHDYVIKIASGFYENPSRFALPSSDGLMLVFEQRTGVLHTILLDEGLLTDVRTAAAGALFARHLAPPPSQVSRIGILGTGTQARLQLQLLADVTACRDVLVWGRTAEHADAYCRDMSNRGFRVEVAPDPAAVAACCNLIVTTTPATAPLLMASDIRPGTHITAVGSDSEGKQELDAAILAKADLIAVDSREQCISRGETAHAIRARLLDVACLVEIGAIIAGRSAGRTDSNQITVADMTGVAVQDVQIATAVCAAIAAC